MTRRQLSVSRYLHTWHGLVCMYLMCLHPSSLPSVSTLRKSPKVNLTTLNRPWYITPGYYPDATDTPPHAHHYPPARSSYDRPGSPSRTRVCTTYLCHTRDQPVSSTAVMRYIIASEGQNLPHLIIQALSSSSATRAADVVVAGPFGIAAPTELEAALDTCERDAVLTSVLCGKDGASPLGAAR